MKIFVALPINLDKTYAMLDKTPAWLWSRAEQLHVTLQFIGDPAPKSLQQIDSQLRQIRAPVFTLHLDKPGCFPSVERARVLYLGVKKDQQLLNLQTQVQSFLAPLGFYPDHANYQPHITLARLKSDRAVAAQWMQNCSFAAESFVADKFILYSSCNGIYRVEYVYPLEGCTK